MGKARTTKAAFGAGALLEIAVLLRFSCGWLRITIANRSPLRGFEEKQPGD
jgi:hypothetical protein